MPRRSPPVSINVRSGIFAYPFALLRTPIRSFARFLALRRAAHLQPAVLAFYADELVNRALRLHSRPLWDALQSHLHDAAPLEADALVALYRYLARMTTRCTPLLMFAGIGVAPIGDAKDLPNALVQAPARDWQLAVFPSGAGVASALRRMLSDPRTRRAANYRLNETIVQRGGLLFYFTERQQGGQVSDAPRYTLASLRNDSQLAPLLREPTRAWRFEELVAVVAAELPEVEPDDVEAYLGAMLDCGVLLDDLRPPSVGPRAEEHLAERTKDRPGLEAIAAASQSMLQLTAQPIAISAPSFDSFLETLEQHPFVKRPAADRAGAVRRAGPPNQAVLHIDIAQGSVPRSLVEKLGAVVRELPDLWLHHHDANRRAIVQMLRQGTVGSRVPLLDLAYRVKSEWRLPSRQPKGDGPRDESARARAEYLQRKSYEADLDGTLAIELDPAEFAHANEIAARTPPIVESLVRLLHVDGALTLQHQSTLAHVGCYTNRFLLWPQNQAMREQLQQIWCAQEAAAAPALLAEITCGGGGRLRDVSQRPITYAHQIVVDGPPSVPADRQVHPSELSVFLRERDGAPVLFWEKRGVPIIARALTALAPSAFSPVVATLLALDAQPGEWQLRLDDERLPVRTPRICRNGIILAAQSFRLTPPIVAALQTPAKLRDDAKLRELLAAWRRRYGVPEIVRLGNLEHNAVDLEGPMAIVELAGMVEKGGLRVSEEFFAEAPMVGSDGPLLCEAVVHVRIGDVAPAIAQAVQPSGAQLLDAQPSRSAHVFSPGSEWLFLKFYYGAGFASDPTTAELIADDLLGRLVAPLISELEARELLSDFHFVRYRDPEAHLRLRLRPRGMSALQLLDTLREKLDAEARARAFDKWLVATYEREVDRYGGASLIAQAERMFTADSRLCLQLLAAFHDDALDEEAELHGLLPIATLNVLYRSFGFDLPARRQLFMELRERQTAQRALDPQRRSELDALYRRDGARIQELIETLEGHTDARTSQLLKRREVAAWYAAFERTAREVAANYRTLAETLTRPASAVIADLFHMHCNRLFGGDLLEAQAVYLSQRAVEGICARRKLTPRS